MLCNVHSIFVSTLEDGTQFSVTTAKHSLSGRVVLIIMILIFVYRQSLHRISVNKWRILFTIAFEFGYRRFFGAANSEINLTTEITRKK